MKPIHSYVVTATLPPSLTRLKDLANNYYWCWHSDARELFVRLDRQLWEEVDHNPVLLLNKIPYSKLLKLGQQADFVNYLDYIYEKYAKYMQDSTWFGKVFPRENSIIAYFSPEYGINESFPNYSGGLGILSGDHIKSASDLGLPLVGVGLLYQQGYFRQVLSNSGWQNEVYKYNDFFTMPLELCKNERDEPIIITLYMAIGPVHCYVWSLNVGRVKIIFLDTNIKENKSDQIKNITDSLYGGDRETRIQQEIVLGVGGMRALEALNLSPAVVHINEGHAAFALLERTKMLMKKFNLNFKSARNLSMASSVFTTHTPVPAGNEEFDIAKIDAYLKDYYADLNMTREEFCELGQFGRYNPNEAFSMTILGLRMCSYKNGVSKLHGRVSREMWARMWSSFPVDEVPISSITNGIHTSTWVAREFAELFDRYLSPNWRYLPDEVDWSKVHSVPSEELWREKQRRRVRLVLFARDYLHKRGKKSNSENITAINEILNPDTLTIGFARRFATYKRANLIFKDMARLKKIFTSTERPVQMIIAGKAHPHDTQGKEVIQSIIHKVREHDLEKHIVFLEDYDMVIARTMVKGCDIWLNNPIRPLEASGTSGMKAALNATLNLSILDGWWDEGYNGQNGFAIGIGEEQVNSEEVEIIESDMLYELLENEIVPTFYNRSADKVPADWVKLMKNCIESNAPTFSTARMVKEYTSRFYMPALNSYKELSEQNGAKAKLLEAWKAKIYTNWHGVHIHKVVHSPGTSLDMGQPVNIKVEVKLGSLAPSDIEVQAFYGSLNHLEDIIQPATKPLKVVGQSGDVYIYEGAIQFQSGGVSGFTVRILPSHPLLASSPDMFLCQWGN